MAESLGTGLPLVASSLPLALWSRNALRFFVGTKKDVYHFVCFLNRKNITKLNNNIFWTVFESDLLISGLHITAG